MTHDPNAVWRDAEPDDLAGMEIFNSQSGRAPCPPPELVHTLGAGTLPPDLEARVAAHVANCGMCRTLNAALDDPSVGELTADEQQRILQRVRAGGFVPARSPRRTWRWAAAAFVTLAGAGSVLVWQARQPSADPPAPAVERNPLAGLQALATTYRLSGVVTNAAGDPLEGVTVGEYLQKTEAGLSVLSRTPFSATSDAAGRYTVSGSPLSRRSMTNLRASKPGYFSAPVTISISSDMHADFRLTPWNRVPFADVAKGTLQPADTACAGVPEPCRQFAVSIPRSGTLEVSLVTAVRQGMDVWLETPNGDVYSPRIVSPLQLAAPVFAGSVCQISVVNYTSEPRQFELTMRLR